MTAVSAFVHTTRESERKRKRERGTESVSACMDLRRQHEKEVIPVIRVA